MKKINLLGVLALFIFATSCQKEDVSNDSFIENAEEIQAVPHYDDSNTKLTAWDNFPAELKNAEVIENNDVNSKAYSYAAGPYGGNGGSAFSYNPPTTHKIHAIAMRTGTLVDKIIVYYRRPNGTIYTGVSRGGNGGGYYLHFFQANEYIKNISGRSGSLLDRLTIVTNKQSFSHGGNGGNAFNVPIPASGFQILGFFGKSGSLIDRIGFYIHTL